MSRTQQQEEKENKHTEKLEERIEEDAIGPVADPDLQIKGGVGSVFHTLG